jgi:hypothetical protein
MTSACSYFVNFIVVNETDAAIEIEYTMKLDGDLSASDGEERQVQTADMPAMVDLKKWKTRFAQDDWQSKRSAITKFDFETGRFTVRIGPNEAMRILTNSDALYFRDGYKHFPISKLEIHGDEGNMSFQSPELFWQFAEKDYSNRFIAYKSYVPSETD